MCSLTRTRLFVGNLPENTDENDLRTAFAIFGEIANLDIKCKSAADSNKQKFAFVTLSASNYDVEVCIKHFSNQNFKGNTLHVTRARESFLERLQREREHTEKLELEKTIHHKNSITKNPVIKLGDILNPRKRKVDHQSHESEENQNDVHSNKKLEHRNNVKFKIPLADDANYERGVSKADKNKQDSDKKRLESMKKKRREFKEKQIIIKSGLIGIDKAQNKKIIFSDNEEDTTTQKTKEKKDVNKKRNTLFDEDDINNDVNFEIKKHFDGVKGQKVLDLQSRYKSDKRFVLDERFIEDDQDENEKDKTEEYESVDLEQTNEKTKQLNILQDVLGISIKSSTSQPNSKKAKSKLGMLRFDPTHPEHAKFLATIDQKPEPVKKSKGKRTKDTQDKETKPQVPEHDTQKVEVSKEQFYKISETLKESIAQPTTFSLRSLFTKDDGDTIEDASQEQETGYIPLVASKETKVRNPLDPGEKNPFVYDSSDSESEEKGNKIKKEPLPQKSELKAVWKESLFFSKTDHRFKEGLAFFNNTSESRIPKERRELKAVMKKRIYNKERKNQMFQKKIGGRKNTMRKSFRKKS